MPNKFLNKIAIKPEGARKKKRRKSSVEAIHPKINVRAAISLK